MIRHDFKPNNENIKIKHANYDLKKQNLYILYSTRNQSFSNEQVDKVFTADLSGVKTLKNEQINASKEYFELGNIEQSLKYDKKPYLSGLYADMLLEQKEYFKSI